MYEGLVFDFDGVIADSMPQHAEAYRRVLAPYGIRPEDHDIFELEGARSESIIRYLLEEADQHAEEGDIQRLADDKQRIYKELGDPLVYPDAPAIIRACTKLTDHLALVTGTRRANLERLIPDSLPLFSAVLAQDSYSHDKPHPEPYAKAAERLDLVPASCVAVENAVRGVQSAKAAGYGSVVAITTTMPSARLRDAGATHVVSDHGALLGQLRSLFAES